jgi:PAS domain S-box-containing protein
MSTPLTAADNVMDLSRELLGENILGQSDRLSDLLPAAVYVCDRDGVIVRYNRKAAELWGRSPAPGNPAERFCGSLGMHRLDGSLLAHSECPMAEVLRTGVAVRDQEVVIERPDGSRAIALVDIDPLRDSQGNLVGAINCFREVTERRRAQAQLRAHDRRWRELLKALPAAVYTTDAAGRITFYNEAAVDLWGYRPELGKAEWCGSWRLWWPDGRPMAHDECPMAVALKEGRAIRGAEAVAERPDGTRVPFIPYPTPLRDDSGALVGAVNMLVEVTERRRAEELGGRLAAIVESSDDAIVSKDLNGIVASWNRGAERLFGYGAEEVVGRPITIIIPPDRQDEEADILARIRRGERIEHYETIRRRKDGSLVEISLTVSPVKDAAGRVIGASKIARDITERRRAQEQQKLLLREMSHRVKNVFALAGGVVGLSARSAATAGEMASAVRDRLAALARAHELTLPDLAEGAGRSDRATTLHALVRAIVSPYVDPERERDDRVVVEGPDVPIGAGAVTSMALLLHELATNAVKHGALSSPAGRVDLCCSVEQDELRLRWQERGGPPVDGPATSEGFGSVLAHRTVTGQFGGRIDRDWRPEGLIVHLSLPLERVAE